MNIFLFIFEKIYYTYTIISLSNKLISKNNSMRKNIFISLAVAGSLLAFTGAGCGGSTTTPTSTTDTKVEEAKVYAVGDEAPAGVFVHTVTEVEALTEIPAEYTIEDFANIAEAQPAPEGFQYVHVTGTTTNNGKETDSVKSISLYVIDSENRQYDLQTDVAIYVESDMMPTSIDVQPTQTVEWEAYYLVPEAAEGLRFVATDLNFVPEEQALIDLAL